MSVPSAKSKKEARTGLETETAFKSGSYSTLVISAKPESSRSFTRWPSPEDGSRTLLCLLVVMSSSMTLWTRSLTVKNCPLCALFSSGMGLIDSFFLDLKLSPNLSVKHNRTFQLISEKRGHLSSADRMRVIFWKE